MLARIFVFLGSLLVMALLAALVGPYFVDWTSYRADFEREASAIVGRKVEVRGEAEARILPFPSLSFTNIVVGAQDKEPALTAAKFSMDAELAPFLRGEVLIFDMRLEKPNATVTIDKDGALDWAIRPSSPFDPRNIALERLTVTDGKVRIIDHAGEREHQLTEVNGTMSARSLAGPWRMDGSLRVDGHRTLLSASTGVTDGRGASRLKVTASPEAFPVTIESEGEISLEKGAPRYEGTFRIVGIKPAKDELRGSDGETPKVVDDSPPNRLTGKFLLADSALAVDSFRFETGPIADPYVAEGEAHVDLGKDPKFSVTANGAQVRLTNWGENVNAGATVGDRLNALQEALALFIKPPIPGVVDVNLPAVVAGDTTIRDVKVSAAPALEGWYLSSASATLPGRSTLEAKGFLTTGTKPRFEGSLLLAVKQPSGFAAWLSKDVDAAVRRLPAAGFSADVFLDGSRQSFNKMEMILGDARFTGHIERTTPPDAKPVLSATLDGGRLTGETGAAFASLFVNEQGVPRFLGHDLDVKLKAGPVEVAGVEAATLDTAMRFKDDRLDIDRFALTEIEGASVSATGSLRQLTGDQVGDVDATIIGDDLEPFLTRLSQILPDDRPVSELVRRSRAYGGLFRNGRFDVVASAASVGEDAADIAVSAKGLAGGTTFSATFSGNYDKGLNRGAPLQVTLNAANESAAPLLALAGLPTLPLDGLGAGTLALDFKGNLDQGLEGSASLVGQDFSAAFNGAVTANDGGVTGHGQTKIEAADIEPWLMAVGGAFPGVGLGTSVALTGNAEFAGSALALGGINGKVADASVAGDVKVDVSGSKPKLTGTLALSALDLHPFAATLLGDEALERKADGWSTAPFTESPVAPVGIDAVLTVGSLSAEPLPTLQEAHFALQSDDHALRLSDLTAKLAGGAVGGLVEVKNEQGQGLLSGQIKLAGADIATLLPMAGIADPSLAGQADLAVGLTASGKSISGLVSSLSGSGSAALRGVTIDGLNPAALPDLIAQSDKIGRNIDAARTQEFAAPLLRAGRFEAGDTQFAFSLASGTLRAPATAFDGKQARLALETQVDLKSQTLSGQGSLEMKPGDNALVGSEPTVRIALAGPVSKPEVSLDTAPLAQFLTQRQLEIEQARVEAMQAALLERQRLRRETSYYGYLQDARLTISGTEAKRRVDTIRLEEINRKRREDEAAKLKAEEDARLKAEEDARQKAEAEARAKAEEQARLKAEDDARKAAEAEQQRKADEEARAKAEEDRRKAEEARSAAEAAPAPGEAAPPVTPEPSDPAPADQSPTPTDAAPDPVVPDAPSANPTPRPSAQQPAAAPQRRPPQRTDQPVRRPPPATRQPGAFPPPPPAPAKTLGDIIRSIGQ